MLLAGGLGFYLLIFLFSAAISKALKTPKDIDYDVISSSYTKIIKKLRDMLKHNDLVRDEKVITAKYMVKHAKEHHKLIWADEFPKKKYLFISFVRE